jgi:hypothetical protein
VYAIREGVSVKFHIGDSYFPAPSSSQVASLFEMLIKNCFLKFRLDIRKENV